MSLDSKVVWSEGMFLNPQHFQQQERYVERLIDSKCSVFGAYAFGVQQIEIDQQLLKLGKVSVLRAQGIFPDGTPFSLPDNEDPPPVLDVGENTHNTLVYLAVPLRRPGAVDLLPKDSSLGMARYYSSEQTVKDNTEDEGENLSVNVGKLRLKLLLDSDDTSGYACIGIVRISEAREDKNVLLDEQFIPTCLDSNVVQNLSGFLNELVGLLHHRGESIAGRLADVGRGGTAEVADYMMLQMINRLEPFTQHLSQVKALHPQILYAELMQMAGEMATFVAKNKRPPTFAPYLHDDLQATFTPVMTILRQYLSMVYEQTAISLKLVEKKFGIRVAEITDRSLLDSAMFILTVRADVAEDVIRTRFPAQIKIGPVERIRQLVNAAMPGISLRPLPVAPRQVPFRAGFTYFELEKQSSFWSELQNSGGFAMHIAGDFPSLEMEFWAIRQ